MQVRVSYPRCLCARHFTVTIHCETEVTLQVFKLLKAREVELRLSQVRFAGSEVSVSILG
jgi:hypothetical protein